MDGVQTLTTSPWKSSSRPDWYMTMYLAGPATTCRSDNVAQYLTNKRSKSIPRNEREGGLGHGAAIPLKKSSSRAQDASRSPAIVDSLPSVSEVCLVRAMVQACWIVGRVFPKRSANLVNERPVASLA